MGCRGSFFGDNPLFSVYFSLPLSLVEVPGLSFPGTLMRTILPTALMLWILASSSRAEDLAIRFKVLAPTGSSTFVPLLYLRLTNERYTPYPLADHLRNS